MDEKRLKKLIEILDGSDLSEITVEENGVRMTVRKGPLTIMEPAESAVSPEAGEKPAHEGNEIRSPMVGTFFLSPAPGQEQYVELGDTIDKGQTVCIIEAMKIMNEITAEEPGRITKILVEDGSAVEFGQPLFYYEPHR
jgi:acetyl-CoA carboxylase biotin carboxyl carrier protein